MHLGIYGGSFDPPHVGHVLAAAYALSAARFDQVLVVPVFAHAFNKQLEPFEHRVKMCELAFADLPRVSVSRIEAELPTPSRTLATLEAVLARTPGASLRLILGTDVLPETAKWHAFDDVERLAPLFVLERAGHERSPPGTCALPLVSSTRVRELLAARGQADADRELRGLVPWRVLDYIAEHQLFRRHG